MRNYQDLTKKEQQVLMLLAEGKTRSEIAVILDVSENTIKTRIKNLRRLLLNLRLDDANDDLIEVAKELKYLPIRRYNLIEKREDLSNEIAEIDKATESFSGYGRDKKEVFYKLLVSKNPEDFQRFKHEVDVLSRLKHPNILDLHDAGWDEGLNKNQERRPFFTMPYHANLLGIVDACEASPAHIDRFLLQLLNVLGYLHWQGIIFNALRPANIFVVKETSKILLMNFGNSVVLEQEQSADQKYSEHEVESVLQTSRSGAISVQSDLWDLGILMYQLFTHGQHPFGAEAPTPEKLARAIAELGKYRIDRDKTKIVEKLLSSDPKCCYPSTIEVADDLLRLKESQFERRAAFRKWVVDGVARLELIGRDDVLNHLKGELSQLFERGRGGVHLIVGEAGVGKTGLLKRIRREARGFEKSEAIVSYVNIEPRSAADKGYMIWRYILPRLIDELELNGLTGEAARAIKRLQDLLKPRSQDGTAPMRESGRQTEQAALNLFQILENKKGPKNIVVLLLLDNLQRIGKDSFNLLIQLCEQIKLLNLPVLIIGSYKELDPELEPDEGLALYTISTKLELPPQALIKLEPLGREASGQLTRFLLTALHPDKILDPDQMEKLTQTISDLGKGYPQRMNEYTQVVAPCDTFDSMLEEIVRKRRSENEAGDRIANWLKSNKRLDDENRLFIATCAILDSSFDMAILRAIYPSEEVLTSHLDKCFDESILIKENKQLKFQHDSFRNAARTLLPENSENIFESVALAIEKTYSSNLIDYYSRLADLWERANKRNKAANYYLQAARFELNTSAYDAVKQLLEKVTDGRWDSEFTPLQQAEIRLMLYFAYMGLGRVELALVSAKHALRVLGYEVIVDSHFRLPLLKASLNQIMYRLTEGKFRQKETTNPDEIRDEFRIAVRCYRALAHSEYFKNNFWNTLYYVLEGLNLCDEVGDNGRGQRADMYAAGKMFAGPLGFGPLKSSIVSVYDKLTESDRIFLEDSSLMPWICLVQGMYYCSNGLWTRAVEYLEKGIELGRDGHDQRRLAENIANRYLCAQYSGDWSRARDFNENLRELIGDGPTSLSPQIRSWTLMFDGDFYLVKGKFKEAEEALTKAWSQQMDDEAALLRIIGVLAEVQLRMDESDRAKTTADKFFTSVHDRPVIAYYAAEGFFGALEVYLEALERHPHSKDLHHKIKRLLYSLLDQPILAFSKRYPIAKPRALLYRARYVLITTSRKDRAKTLTNRALGHAKGLKMLYDEGLIREFIGAHFCDDNLGHEQLVRAFEIFNMLGATWNRDRVDDRLNKDRVA